MIRVLNTVQQKAYKIKAIIHPNTYLDESKNVQNELCQKYNIKKNDGERFEYLVCYREVSDIGFGNQLFALVHILEYAEKNGIHVVVHRQEENQIEICNQWEECFEQINHQNLSRIYRDSKVYFTTSKNPPYGYWNDFWNMSDRKLNYYKALYSKYIHLNSEMKNMVRKFKERNFNDNDCILGVLARGTDYNQTVAFGHPVQPSVEQLIEKINESIERLAINKIFIATEDNDILNGIRNEYGNMVTFFSQPRLRGEKQKTVNRLIRESHVDLDEMMKSYVASLYILSETDYLIAGNTSGSMILPLIGDNRLGRFRFELGTYSDGDINSILR